MARPTYEELEQRVQILEQEATLRDQVEKAPREGEERLALALQATNDGIWDWDIINEKIYISDRFKEMIGYKGDASTAAIASWSSYIHPDHYDRVMSALQAHLDGKSAYDVDYLYRRSDEEEYRWYNVRGLTLFDENGKAYRLVGSIRDIHERKQAEEALQRARIELERRVQEQTAELLKANEELRVAFAEQKRSANALQESEKRFRTLFEHSPMPMMEWDLSGAKLHFDHLKDSGVSDFGSYFTDHPEEVDKFLNLAKILDVNQESIHFVKFKSKQELLDNMPDLFTEETMNVFRKEMIALADGRTRFEGEMPIRNMSGEVRMLSLRLSVVPGFEDTLSKVLVSYVDITERERTKEALLKAKEVAEASSKARDDFLAGMSHELRTPLNAIIGFSQVLQDRFFGPLTKKQEKYVKDILKSGTHLFSLVEDILDFSRMEAGQVEFEPSPVNIKALLENSLNRIREKALKNKFHLALQVAREVEDLEIQADEHKLNQVMFNLLSNAAKFTPSGGKIRVTAQLTDSFTVESVSADDMDNEPVLQEPIAGSQEQGTPRKDVRISVEDTGIGVAPEDQEKIFDVFYQDKGGIAGKTPGTGLGLSLSRRLVEMHGGRIWVESEGEGKGARFFISLPIVKNPCPEDQVFEARNKMLLTG